MREPARRDLSQEPTCASAEPVATLNPSAEFPPLDENELAVLHQIGRRWASAGWFSGAD
jgi:hypothetical protein